ncbi:MAG: ABC transporter permease [Spirochaetes bacterium]|nr:ABC transporter permease [Spirochaetota bacterium]
MTGILASIAIRNLARHGKRTLITSLVLTVGIGMFIFFDSLLAGMDRMTIDSMISYGQASLTLMTPAYEKESRALPIGPDYGLSSPENTLEALKTLLPHSTAAAPRTTFAAFASNRIDSLAVLGTAVDPHADALVFGVAGGIKAGTWFGSSGSADGGNQAVLGAKLAADLGLSVGDWFVLSARTTGDYLNADEFVISGLVDVPAQDITQSGLFLSFGAARSLLGEDLPVTSIAVALPRAPSLDAQLKEAAAAAVAVEKAFPGTIALPIGEKAKDYLAMRNMKAKYSTLIILIVLLIAGVGIVNTILMSVYSRIKEIGVLRAYGMLPSQIRRLFSLEGFFLGLLGSAGGLALGCLGVWASAVWGIRIDKMLGGMDLGVIPLGGAIRGEWHPSIIAAGFIFGVLASWISARIPASRAGRLEVTEALRFV